MTDKAQTTFFRRYRRTAILPSYQSECPVNRLRERQSVKLRHIVDLRLFKVSNFTDDAIQKFSLARNPSRRSERDFTTFFYLPSRQ